MAKFTNHQGINIEIEDWSDGVRSGTLALTLTHLDTKFGVELRRGEVRELRNALTDWLSAMR